MRPHIRVALIPLVALTGPSHATCSADLDEDGVVGVFDLLALLSCQGPPCDDVDGDGVVTGVDLALMLIHWGPCDQDLPVETTTTTLVLRPVTDPGTAAAGLREFDLFAPFADPNEVVVSVLNADLITSGTPSGFVQAPSVFASPLPIPAAIWDFEGLTYDSFVTIGPEFGDDNVVSLDPGFDAPDFMSAGRIGPGAGWMADLMQGRAGDYEDLEVRLARLTLEPGTTVAGTLTVASKGAWFAVFAEATIDFTARLSDIDGDGVTGFQDLLSVIAAHGPCPGPTDPCPADLDGSGNVGFADLLIVLTDWG